MKVRITRHMQIWRKQNIVKSLYYCKITKKAVWMFLDELGKSRFQKKMWCCIDGNSQTSLWRRASARKVRFESFYGDELTLRTQLMWANVFITGLKKLQGQKGPQLIAFLKLLNRLPSLMKIKKGLSLLNITCACPFIYTTPPYWHPYITNSFVCPNEKLISFL